MLNLTISSDDMDFLTKGEPCDLDTKDFDAWEAITGPQTVMLNGDTARALVWFEEPNCPCCHGCKPVYRWSLQLL